MQVIYHEEYGPDRAVMIEMRAMLALQPPAEFGPQFRPIFDLLTSMTECPSSVHCERAELDGVAGWWCVPPDAALNRAILYFHGGGYVAGSAAAFRGLAGQVAVRAGARTFVCDYRLAPEHPFPAALEDGYAAYRSLADSGYRVALAGDSAGGGLALALLVQLLSSAELGKIAIPAAVTVMSPWTDLALMSPSMKTRAQADALLTPMALNQAADYYLCEASRYDPHASPVYGDFCGAPSVMVHVGDNEILLDDAIRVANKIHSADGEVELHIWRGMIHVFPANFAVLKVAAEALDLIGLHLRKHLLLNPENPAR